MKVLLHEELYIYFCKDLIHIGSQRAVSAPDKYVGSSYRIKVKYSVLDLGIRAPQCINGGHLDLDLKEHVNFLSYSTDRMPLSFLFCCLPIFIYYHSILLHPWEITRILAFLID